MTCKNSKYSSKKNIVVVTTIVLAGLFVLDVIYQGEVYKRLPTVWQNKLSEWIGR